MFNFDLTPKRRAWIKAHPHWAMWAHSLIEVVWVAVAIGLVSLLSLAVDAMWGHEWVPYESTVTALYLILWDVIRTKSEKHIKDINEDTLAREKAAPAAIREHRPTMSMDDLRNSLGITPPK